MLLDCFASLRSFLSLCLYSLVCCLLYTRRKIKDSKSKNFVNPLLISIQTDKQKYFKNFCKKNCQFKNLL